MTDKIRKIIIGLAKEVQKEFPGATNIKATYSLGCVKLEIEKTKPFSHITIEEWLSKEEVADDT